MINWGKLLNCCIRAVFLGWAMPPAILGGFGRIEALFTLFAQYFTLGPSFIGNFGRGVFYKMTLGGCSIDVVIGLGSYFSRRGAVLLPNVSIGGY